MLRRALSALLLGTSLGLAALTGPAVAQSASVPPPDIAARSWFLFDVTTNTVLYSQTPDERVEPASLTKLMTAYVVFEALRDGTLKPDARPPVSNRAYKSAGSRMFVDPRSPATVDELLHGLIIQSGNDAAIILAEAVAGSEEQFAEQMNAETRRLGMKNSHFVNASGLPAPDHYSSARDMAVLATRIIKEFPQYYRLYSEREYTFNGVRQPNRNRLLAIDPSVDGMKTGFTDAAGYCLVASAHREQKNATDPQGSQFSRRILSVLLGASSDATRATESQKLLNYGFQNFEALQLYRKNQPVGNHPVWKGQQPTVSAGFADDVLITAPRAQIGNIKGEIERTEPLIAPIHAGQRIGTLRIRLGETVIAERPLIALETVETAGWFKSTWDTIRLWVK
ncbi:D-alanyl-D-alanine carboxypeptidase [Lautropia dentalis]|uniref:serine-type D-Ala-D-Ala carboxypeptidase n=2 Tax=Lautropia dentalis TaxID=2490857 RepID=A0A426FPN7_9BURK|nr:D-alanyl-D-alanine carboxypeptidase family protein [Lautropia dentalis]RRN44601.1 D-alanyl-D-alanine carboxypeptidase [Lautropia dentalis]